MRFLACLVIALATAAGWAQPQYEVVDLTKMFGEELTAVDINNQGVVVGHFRLSSTQYQACTIQNGKLTMLPRFEGNRTWYPLDITDNGDVLGAAGTTTVLYSNGKVFDIGVPGGNEFPAGRALNDKQTVVGSIPVGIPQAFTWEEGVTTILPGLSAGSDGAMDINDSGAISGFSEVQGGDDHAVRWINGKIFDIHPAWAENAYGVSINALGEVAGDGWAITGGQHGFLWRDGQVIQLGNFGGGQSQAYDVNDLSQVVGWGTDPGGVPMGFFWDQGTMHRLEDLIPGGSGFQIIEAAESINNRGEILTSGFTGSAGHELLLNPVPEPSSFLAILTGVLVLAISRRKGRRG